MKRLQITIIVSIAIFLLLLSAITYFISKPDRQDNSGVESTMLGCLAEDEYVDIKIDKKSGEYTGKITYFIKESESAATTRAFEVDSIYFSYHPYEIHRCGIYVMRIFNFDWKKFQPLDNHSVELWKYNYNGSGENMLTLSNSNYNFDFRIDPQEKYIVLERGHMGLQEYALVIKDFQLDKDAFILLRQFILEKYPNFFGGFGLKSWTKSGDAFWANLFSGAQVEAFIRILRDTWTAEVLPAPEDTQGGDALNAERGYVTYNTGPGWIGIHELAEQIYDEWRKEGKIVGLHLYNLFTKEDILIATSSDPSWWGRPTWDSDTELEYELSTGEIKIYKIK